MSMWRYGRQAATNGEAILNDIGCTFHEVETALD